MSDVYSSVQDYYGRVLGGTQDLVTTACCTTKAPPSAIRTALTLVPEQVKNKYYGCGIVVPLGIQSKAVLDLGSGSGQDCYVCAALVGPRGKVIGVDMTEEQLKVANDNIQLFAQNLAQANAFGYSAETKPDLKFVKGYMEALDRAGVDAESIDIAISNCVINLSPDKPQVLKQVYRVLKYGGEFYFSDVFCDRRLSEKVRSHKVLYGECISGALYINDFIKAAKDAGFNDVRWVESREIEVSKPEHKEIVGEARFFSITWRCFKVNDLEPSHENYGQVAVYKGTIPDMAEFVFDNQYSFETGKSANICGNTAKLLSQSWLKDHFEVTGDQSQHYGQFGQAPDTISSLSSGCCSGESSCC